MQRYTVSCKSGQPPAIWCIIHPSVDLLPQVGPGRVQAAWGHRRTGGGPDAAACCLSVAGAACALQVLCGRSRGRTPQRLVSEVSASCNAASSSILSGICSSIPICIFNCTDDRYAIWSLRQQRILTSHDIRCMLPMSSMSMQVHWGPDKGWCRRHAAADRDACT